MPGKEISALLKEEENLAGWLIFQGVVPEGHLHSETLW